MSATSDAGCPAATEVLKNSSDCRERLYGRGLGAWDTQEKGSSLPLLSLKKRRLQGQLRVLFWVLLLGRVRNSRAELLLKVNGKKLRCNSHRLQKGNLLLGIRKKFCCDDCWTRHTGTLWRLQPWRCPSRLRLGKARAACSNLDVRCDLQTSLPT